MAKSAPDIIDALEAATSLTEVDRVVRAHVQDLGFEHYTYHVVRPPDGPRTPFVLTTYPDGWAERYTEQHYVSVDPTVPTAATSLMPFAWSAAFAGRGLPDQQKLIRDEAAEFGLTEGGTVPLHGPGSALATLNVASRVHRRAFETLFRSRLGELMVLATCSHERILRLAFSNRNRPLFKLAPRERECLLWTARGKTVWEVGEILGLSHETVRDYLRNACTKLGVYSKTHAVVKATMLGIIVP